MPVEVPRAGGAFRTVPYMGVIYVVAEAMKLGFTNGDPDWCNLGQGQPEVGELAGAPPRYDAVRIEPADHAYGPLEGTPEVRQRIADHVNRLFRGGRKPYTAANVGVAQGGRLALSRIGAALGKVRIGFQRPDYTAYQDMLELHLGRVTPVGIRTRRSDGFMIDPSEYAGLLESKDLDVFLLSNPCNPTGVAIRDEGLKTLVDVSRETGRTLILDEFYSHFVYDRDPAQPDGDATPGGGPISGAAFVDDPDTDPVLLVDGLTKSFRYPGWRMGWVLGPPETIENIARTASSLDGGPSRIVQRATLDVLEPARADQETRALREAFCRKRNIMVRRLKELGLEFAATPNSTFYCWASIRKLPPPFDDAMEFFRRALARKVMTVPGEFFDVNPGGRRKSPSPFRQWMRFSFGPPEDNMILGLDRLARMLDEV
jgi:hypothetical protein